MIALGLSEQQAKSSIRVSYGKYNCIDEVENVITAVCDAYSKITANR
jgi:cysteine desulfurase